MAIDDQKFSDRHSAGTIPSYARYSVLIALNMNNGASRRALIAADDPGGWSKARWVWVGSK
jgi:hypothetical protein